MGSHRDGQQDEMIDLNSMVSAFRSRLATPTDLPVLREVMTRATLELQAGFLPDQAIAASTAIMGLDTQLIDDRTYFIVEADDRIAGCGGWSRRATLYGGDHATALREPRLLDCATEAARIRAMYTHPDFVRRGVGRMILALCEAAAHGENFVRAELMATLAGEPLYRACGYAEIERTSAQVDGIYVPLVLMGKRLEGTASH